MSKQLTPRQINAQRKKDGKPALNFRLFRKVIKKLKTVPEAYDQRTFGRRAKDAPCGTAACIAGWGMHLSGVKTLKQLQRNPSVSYAARKEFGLADSEGSVVFDGQPGIFGWPEPYGGQWRAAATARQQARVAIRYLQHIIKTGKVTE
jgi:hypothetical protein